MYACVNSYLEAVERHYLMAPVCVVTSIYCYWVTPQRLKVRYIELFAYTKYIFFISEYLECMLYGVRCTYTHCILS
jgi:hypothetical protein